MPTRLKILLILSFLPLTSCGYLFGGSDGDATRQVKMEDKWNDAYQKAASKIDRNNAAVRDTLEQSRKECEAWAKQLNHPDWKLQMIGVTTQATTTSTSAGRLSCGAPPSPPSPQVSSTPAPANKPAVPPAPSTSAPVPKP